MARNPGVRPIEKSHGCGIEVLAANSGNFQESSRSARDSLIFRAHFIVIRAEGKHVSPLTAKGFPSRSGGNDRAMEMGNAEIKESEKVMQAPDEGAAAAGKRVI